MSMIVILAIVIILIISCITYNKQHLSDKNYKETEQKYGDFSDKFTKTNIDDDTEINIKIDIDIDMEIQKINPMLFDEMMEYVGLFYKKLDEFETTKNHLLYDNLLKYKVQIIETLQSISINTLKRKNKIISSIDQMSDFLQTKIDKVKNEINNDIMMNGYTRHSKIPDNSDIMPYNYDVL